MKRCLALGFLLLLMSASLVIAQDEPGKAAVAAEALQGWYSERTGLWDHGIGGTNWWNSANALTALIDTMRATGSQDYLTVVANTFERNQGAKFLNNFYDDAQWWALAWVDAYDLTGDARYLDAAKTIFADTTAAWDDQCGGGVWWSRDRGYKNAITNELFLLLAARLHLRTPGDSDYLAWAQREWDWFRSSGLINGVNLVNDGFDAACRSNRQTTWTYNQGVILAGLTDLYRAAHDQTLLDQAVAIADAATTRLVTADGILREPCEPASCGADGTQFKGIFVRHLAYLYQETHTHAYRDFILRNADALGTRDRNAQNQFGLVWTGPFDAADASRQSSALDALNAAVPFAGQPLPPPYQANLALQAAVTADAACVKENVVEALIDSNSETELCVPNGTTLTFDLNAYYRITSVDVEMAHDYAIEYVAQGRRGESVWSPFDENQPPVTNRLRLRFHQGAYLDAVFIYGTSAEPPLNTADLALNRPARGSSACSPSELPAQAVDGRGDTKWCSGATSNVYLLVDLGAEQSVTRFVVRHAGSNGENPLWNTRAFEIQSSPDGRDPWTTVVSISDNSDSVTTHDIAPTPMRYVRLLIVDPQIDPENRAARIYEFEVYGG